MKCSTSFYAMMILSVMLVSRTTEPLTPIIYVRKKNVEKDEVMRGLTLLVIEKALSKLGNSVRDKVANELHSKYNCYFPDCYDHPEYLEEVLRSVLGNSLGVAAETIISELIHHSDEGMQALIKRMDSNSYKSK